MREGAGNRLFAGCIMKNIALIATASIFTAAGQLSIRKGMIQIGRISFDISLFGRLPDMFANIFLWLGIFGYGFSLLLWLIIISRIDISLAYLIQCSLSFAIVTVAAHFLFGECVPLMRIAGLLVICLGIFIVLKAG
jgi:multidrug transporter EmrE-like cation transporter